MRPVGRIFSSCILFGLWKGSAECMEENALFLCTNMVFAAICAGKDFVRTIISRRDAEARRVLAGTRIVRLRQ